MAATEIELSGQVYRLGKLSAMQQLHVSRKLAPVLPTVLPLISRIQAGALEDALDGKVDALVAAAEPLADALAGMSDEHVEYVIAACLAVVRRQQGDAWRPVWQGGQCMFDDMDMGAILPLVARVVMDSLGSFMRGLATKATASP